MTLVLSVVTREFVMQASDRRLFDLLRRVPLAEGANKAVLWPSRRLVFGYTGLASVGTGMAGETHLWLAETLFEAREEPDLFEALAQRATRTFGALRVPRTYKRHSFVAVGWDSDDAADLPSYWSVSNCEDEAGRVLSSASDVFSVRRHELMYFERSNVVAAGVQLRPGELREIQRDVGSALRSLGGASAVGLILVRALRRVSARIPESVGRAALVNTLPAAALPSPFESGDLGALFELAGVAFSAPTSAGPTFFSFPETEGAPVHYMPVVIADWGIAGGGEMWLGQQPPWWRD
jgi:hypothetical protein